MKIILLEKSIEIDIRGREDCYFWIWNMCFDEVQDKETIIDLSDV